MRFIRSAATTLTLAGTATLAASAVPGFNVPAFAQGPTVDVSPSTATPGESVTFTVACDHTTAIHAWLLGGTLGLPLKIPMNLVQNGVFSVTINLPTSISPGTYLPPLTCSDGTMRSTTLTVITVPTPTVTVRPAIATPGATVTVTATCGTGLGTISATLDGSALGLPAQIQMQQSHPGQFFATLNLPTSISPGQYSLSVVCNPTGSSGSASLLVNPSAPPPTGPPMTGDGTTSSAMGGPFTTAGLALLAAGGLAVVTGAIWKRRRAGAGS
jgi:hypothetical protein